MRDPVTIRHKRVRTGAVTLHVAIAGDGPPVILLHGFPEHWRSWQHQIAPLAQAGFSVWAPDLRGYNESGRPGAVEAYAMAHLTADVAALVRATGAPRAHIGGHDWGGVIAWAFASAYPDLVDRLVILNAPHAQLYRRALLNPRQLFKSWYVGLFLVPGLAEWLLSARDFHALRRIFTHTPSRPGAYTPEEIDALIAPIRPRGALTAALNYYRANAGLRRLGLLARGRVEADTLVIWGERDQALSTVLLRGLDRVAPRVRIHRIPDAAHWVHHEAPDEVNRVLLPFLARR